MNHDKGLEREIEKYITGEEFDDFDNKSYELGRDKLKKLYLKCYYKTENINIKWSILYRLIYVEQILDNKESVKMYTAILKKDMEKNAEYIKINKKKYIDLLSYYLPIYENDLDQEEVIKLYEFSYNVYKKYLNNKECDRNFLCAINTKFNLYFKLGCDEVVISIINTLSSLHNNQATLIIEDMLNDIKKKNIDMYNKITKLIA